MLLTLDEFIARGDNTWPHNMYVTEPGWKTLYVRWTKRCFRTGEIRLCFDLANIEAKTKGAGDFGRLLSKLCSTLPGEVPIYVESVVNERFARALRSGRWGFEQVQGAVPPSFMLPRGGALRHVRGATALAPAMVQ